MPLKVSWLTLGLLLSIGAAVGVPLASTGSRVQEVSLLTRDGLTIGGSYYPPHQGPAPGVILLHMLDRDRHDWEPLATRLHGAGWAVLTLDFRGHGQSVSQGGKTLPWSSFQPGDFNKMVLDVEAARLFLGRQKQDVEQESLALVGASIGGNVALNFAADHPEVRALVLLSPGLDYRGVPADVAMKRYAASRRAVLIASSEEDRYAADSSKKLKDLSADHGELILYRSAGHGTRMFSREKALEERIVRWLLETMHSR